MVKFGLLLMLLCSLEKVDSAIENCVSRVEFDNLKNGIGQELRELHKLESLIVSLTEKVESQSKEIDTLKQSNVQFKAEVQEQRSTLQTNKAINDNPKEVKQTLNKMKQVTPKRRVRNDIGNKRYLLGPMEGGIAFSVTLTQWDLINLGQGQTIHFDHIISNLGNSYNMHTGTFTAPVQGWYILSLTLMSSGNENQELEVVVNNSPIFHCYIGNATFDSASRTIVYHMSSGDDVWVRTALWAHSDKLHGNDHTSFTGFLLYAD